MKERTIDWPSQITFKSVFRNKPYLHDSIRQILAEHDISATVENRESKTSKFLSFTIEGEFQSDSELQMICSEISSLEGFMCMF